MAFNFVVLVLILMMNLLILTDFSKNAWNALKYAQGLFQKNKCNFYLLHTDSIAEHPISLVYSKSDNAMQLEEFTIPSKEKLNNLLLKVETSNLNKNHKYFAMHERGFLLETIKKNIAEKKIDLIVMGTKGVTGFRKRIIGSNAGDVITKIKCNALIIPKGVAFSIPQEVVFPTDYNIFYSHNVLEAITKMLGWCQGNIRVINVSKFGKSLSSSQEKNQEYLFDYLMETFPNNNSFHTITNKSVNAAIQSFVESRGIDMILMVAKNLNFLQQMLFDSLIEKISFHTTVPFFVIHE